PSTCGHTIPAPSLRGDPLLARRLSRSRALPGRAALAAAAAARAGGYELARRRGRGRAGTEVPAPPRARARGHRAMRRDADPEEPGVLGPGGLRARSRVVRGAVRSGLQADPGRLVA